MTTVFAALVLSSMLILIFSFLSASKTMAEKTMAKAYIHSASRSVLSEYNVLLKTKYNLFATDVNKLGLRQRAGYYLDYNFYIQRLIDLQMERLSMEFDDYALTNLNVFEEELEKIIIFPPSWENMPEDLPFENPFGDQLFSNLPSKGQANSLLNIESLKMLLSNPGSGLDQGKGKYARCKYILDYFNYFKRKNQINYTFFSNEAEYILYGKFSDLENLARFKIDFIAIRGILNIMHIKSDSEKMEKLSLTANLLTPGPEAEATLLLLMTAWASAEAINDWRLLESGCGVEAVKGKNDWAINLNSVIKSLFQTDSEEPESINSFIKPERESDFKYENYLKIFLLCQKRESQILRILDLIEINIKCLQEETFNIRECYTGFSYIISINGKGYNGEEKY